MERRAQMERKVNGERTANDVNALCTQDERFIRSASGVMLILYFVGNQEKKTNRLQYPASCSAKKNSILSFSLT